MHVRSKKPSDVRDRELLGATAHDNSHTGGGVLRDHWRERIERGRHT